MSAKKELLRLAANTGARARERLIQAGGGSALATAVVNDALEHENWKDYLSDVVNQGCASGIVPDLVYYADSTAWYDRVKDEIWDLLYEEAQNQGMSALALLAKLNGADAVGRDEQLKNLLAWFAYEQTAARLLQAFDNE